MSENLSVIDLQVTNPNEALTLFGTNDKYLKQIEEKLNVSIVTRGEKVSVSGADKDKSIVQDVLVTLLSVIRKGLPLSERDVVYAVDLAKEGKINKFETLFQDVITKNTKGKPIRVKTLGQKDYIAAIRSNDLVFGIGPAGTGKTYLAVVMARSEERRVGREGEGQRGQSS